MKSFFDKNKLLLEILALFLIVSTGLAWYSSLEEPIVMDLEIQQTEMNAFLTKRIHPDTMLLDTHTTAELVLKDSSVIAEATNERQEPEERDSSSQYILLTGDSMCEEQMFAFKKYCKKNGHKLKTRIWYSSSTKQWSKSDTLAAFIRKYRPTFIIFNLGSNELFIRNIKERRDKFVADIVKEADDSKTPFVWIGPPNWKEDTGINDLIVKNVGQDRYFESKNLHFDRKRDGAHPTRASSAVWADTISRWIMHTCRYKGQILLEDPKKIEEARPYIAANDESIAGRTTNESFKITDPKREAKRKQEKEDAQRKAEAAKNLQNLPEEVDTVTNNTTTKQDTGQTDNGLVNNDKLSPNDQSTGDSTKKVTKPIDQLPDPKTPADTSKQKQY
ncbi:MAG: SGNH/GDSL hydrolase family protein [Saprospiraceae bacterium]|nr:SGNH/GDSL hydrolase family protein [Saprospiraceae bacterium]